MCSPPFKILKILFLLPPNASCRAFITQNANIFYVLSQLLIGVGRQLSIIYYTHDKKKL